MLALPACQHLPLGSEATASRTPQCLTSAMGKVCIQNLQGFRRVDIGGPWTCTEPTRAQDTNRCASFQKLDLCHRHWGKVRSTHQLACGFAAIDWEMLKNCFQRPSFCLVRPLPTLWKPRICSQYLPARPVDQCLPSQWDGDMAPARIAPLPFRH